MATYVSQAEFARLRGWSRARVSQLKNATPSRLVLNAQGEVDVEATNALLEATADPAKQGVVDRHARERIEREVTPTAAAKAPEAPQSQRDETYQAFNKARAEKEAELATLARMKREEQQGVLITRAEVQRDVESLAAIVSKGLTGIAARVMPVINGEPDAGRREQILQEEIRKVLIEFADAAAALAQE